jgi:hypothetical protein
MMPRFFFHVCNGDGYTSDDEGIDLAGQTAARGIAIDSVRSMVAEDVRRGIIDLDGRILIRDLSGNDLLTVEFGEAFELRIPSVRNRS